MLFPQQVGDTWGQEAEMALLTIIPKNTFKESVFASPATLRFAGLRSSFLKGKGFHWGTQEKSC